MWYYVQCNYLHTSTNGQSGGVHACYIDIRIYTYKEGYSNSVTCVYSVKKIGIFPLFSRKRLGRRLPDFAYKRLWQGSGKQAWNLPQPFILFMQNQLCWHHPAANCCQLTVDLLVLTSSTAHAGCNRRKRIPLHPHPPGANSALGASPGCSSFLWFPCLVCRLIHSM